jgi:hypothetical protein
VSPVCPDAILQRLFLHGGVSGNAHDRGFAHMHVPQFCSAKHCNSTGVGPFADALVELDDTVGAMVSTLVAADKRSDTIVFLTGDNGPWENKCTLTGSKGPFTGSWQATHGSGGSSAKTTLWEGGHRVVSVVSWPGQIAAGVVSKALTSTLDYFPTFAGLAGLKLPGDREYHLCPISFAIVNQRYSDRTGIYHTIDQLLLVLVVRVMWPSRYDGIDLSPLLLSSTQPGTESVPPCLLAQPSVL